MLGNSSMLGGPAILMLTSGDRADDLASSRNLGVCACLIKPIRRSELRAAIIKAITERRQWPTSTAPAPQARNLSLATPGFNILLAEDNIVNQMVAVGILEKQGHRVVVAENGKLALDCLDRETFDLILMDVQMPEMDRFEATAAIRRKQSRSGTFTPIIAMTAHAMEGDRERCIRAGMDDYTSKPIRFDVLADMIKMYCRSAHAHAPAAR